jgi:hypothetical protein
MDIVIVYVVTLLGEGEVGGWTASLGELDAILRRIFRSQSCDGPVGPV